MDDRVHGFKDRVPGGHFLCFLPAAQLNWVIRLGWCLHHSTVAFNQPLIDSSPVPSFYGVHGLHYNRCRNLHVNLLILQCKISYIKYHTISRPIKTLAISEFCAFYSVTDWQVVLLGLLSCKKSKRYHSFPHVFWHYNNEHSIKHL